MKRTLSVVVLLFCSVLLFAQSSIYKPGLVVDNKGDTLKGWIDYGNWLHSPRKINFKTESSNTLVVKYTTGDLSYFEITGLDAYKKAIVTKDMRPVAVTDITPETMDSTETDTVFLRALVKGMKYSLYEFIDFKEHYYLQESDKEPMELSYKLYMEVAAAQVEELFIFRDQLKEIAAKNNLPSLQWDIDHARYTEKKLSRIVLALNGSGPAEVYGTAGEKGKTKLQVFGSAGMNYNLLNMSGDFPLVGMNFKVGIAPVFVAGVDFPNSRNFNDFTFRLEVAYTQNTYKGDKNGFSPYINDPTYETYTLQQRNITPAISILYNFRRLKKTRFYAGGGVAVNFSSYGVNRYTYVDKTSSYSNTSSDDYLVLEKEWGSLFLKLGARINRNLEIGATASLLGSFTKYELLTSRPVTYSTRISWFFLAHHQMTGAGISGTGN
jgi:hypothetical protein